MLDLEKTANRSSWKSVPFLRLFLPLISGLLFEYYVPLGAVFLQPGFAISVTVLIFYNCIPFRIKFRAPWIYGFAMQVSFVSLGSILMHLHEDKPLTESEYYSNSNKNYLLIQVMNDPVQRRSSYKCLARIDCLVKNQTCYYQNEKVLVYFNNDRLSRQLTGSSWIITDKILQPIENFKSLDFDYKKFCRLRHINSQLFLKENDYTIVSQAETKSVLTILDSSEEKYWPLLKGMFFLNQKTVYLKH